MNKSKYRCSKTAAFLCAETRAEDGIAPRFLHEKNSRKKNTAKDLQLGKEAARIVSLVLAGETHQPLLQDLLVLSVLPEHHGQQLCVTVAHYQTEIVVEAAQVLTALHSIQGLLRTALAQSIHRKKVPLLSFRYAGLLDQEII